MAEISDGGPAFPVIEPNHPKPIILTGMTLRDYFAASALTGMLAREAGVEVESATFEKNALDAYKAADAMIAQRSK